MGKPKLLIVDDELSTRNLLTQIFSNMGHDVNSAEDGFSALEQIRAEVPDILLSDLNMPRMSGFELLSVVRRRIPEIYVIATSGAFRGDEVPHGIAAQQVLSLVDSPGSAPLPLQRLADCLQDPR